jgi:hypothetical protein
VDYQTMHSRQNRPFEECTALKQQGNSSFGLENVNKPRRLKRIKRAKVLAHSIKRQKGNNFFAQKNDF